MTIHRQWPLRLCLQQHENIRIPSCVVPFHGERCCTHEPVVSELEIVSYALETFTLHKFISEDENLSLPEAEVEISRDAIAKQSGTNYYSCAFLHQWIIPRLNGLAFYDRIQPHKGGALRQRLDAEPFIYKSVQRLTMRCSNSIRTAQQHSFTLFKFYSIDLSWSKTWVL